MSANGLFKLAGAVLTLCLASCATDPEVAAQRAAEAKARADAAVIAAAVLSEARPDTDVADDAARRPQDVMNFMQLERGHTVLELEAGSGYYTEMMSFVVGDLGRVYMQNPPVFDSFLGDSLLARLGGNRLPNVVQVRSNFDDLSQVPTESVDVVTWVLGPHELYFTEFEGQPIALGNVETTYQEIYRVLKPGGSFVALDHMAKPGAPESVGNTLHRVDPGVVQIEAEKAGLAYELKSEILENDIDDLTRSVFEPDLRRKTSRFLMRFRKAG